MPVQKVMDGSGLSPQGKREERKWWGSVKLCDVWVR